jgi:hypothetical protein
MIDDLFAKHVTTWKAWVEERRELWSHIHLSGVVLWHEEEWLFVSGTVVLAVAEECEPPAGIDPKWEREVCAFRVSVPLEQFEPLMEGLGVSEWAKWQVPGLQAPVRFFSRNASERLTPTGEPRLEAPNFNSEGRSESLWPRYSVELWGPTLEKVFAADYRNAFAALDRRLVGKGKLGLSELAQHFGNVVGSSGQLSDIWNRQTSVKLIAPLHCRLDSTGWDDRHSAFSATVAIDDRVPRGRAAVVLHDPTTVGFPDPVPIPPDRESPVTVMLSSKKVSDRASIKLLLFDEEIQKDRTSPPFGGASAAHMVAGLVRPEPNARYGGWKILDPLGRGGQADVRRAENGRLAGALKEVRAERSDTARITRLRREIGFLKRFRDVPFLVRLLHSSDEDDPLPFLITELAPLGNAEQQAPIFKGDVWRTLRLARDVAIALGRLHEAEVIHRDVKSKNIFLYTPDTAVLADLGVAYDRSLSSVTTTDDLVQSTFFSPPESNVIGQPTPAFDVFMLGQTIYHLVTGGKKYRTDGGEAPDVRQYVPSRAGQVLTSLLDRMVAAKSQNRIQTMPDVIAAIDEALATTFGARPPNACASCGRAPYEPFGGLRLTSEQLTVTSRGEEVPLGNQRIVLHACRACGWCGFQLSDEGRKALFR